MLDFIDLGFTESDISIISLSRKKIVIDATNVVSVTGFFSEGVETFEKLRIEFINIYTSKRVLVPYKDKSRQSFQKKLKLLILNNLKLSQ